MTLLYAEGPAIVSAFKKRGFNVFVDLKLHDIPHQVAGAAASLVECGADMVTFHTVGGVPMMAAGPACVEDRAGLLNVPCPITLGVTVLTSMDADTLRATGVERPVVDQVRALAQQAREAGLSGVVASPQEAAMLRETSGARCCYRHAGRAAGGCGAWRPDARGDACKSVRRRRKPHRGRTSYYAG